MKKARKAPAEPPKVRESNVLARAARDPDSTMRFLRLRLEFCRAELAIEEGRSADAQALVEGVEAELRGVAP